MSVPKATKTTFKRKDGTIAVSFENNVDAVNFTIRELIYAANRDVGIFLAKACNAEARGTLRGFKNSKGQRLNPNAKLAPKGDVRSPAFQYWSRKKENDLQIGIKAETWYGIEQELGTHNQPKKGIMRSTVEANIDKIREIQGQYLSAINDDVKAKQMAEDAERLQEGE